MEFTKPNPFNGTTFNNELEFSKIKIKSFYDDGQGHLVIDADEKLSTAIQGVLNQHDGSPTPPTILEKLESSGINLEELRIALGL